MIWSSEERRRKLRESNAATFVVGMLMLALLVVAGFIVIRDLPTLKGALPVEKPKMEETNGSE